MAGGWGWAGANFAPAGSTWWNYLLHTFPILIVLVFSLGLFSVVGDSEQASSNGGWSAIGLDIFAGISLLGLTVGIIFGAINPNGAFGIATFGDWVAAVVLILGDLLWLTAQISPRHAEIKVANN